MIINRITSENVLKYARLDVKDLPTRGIIAVSGQNESGKSSIGEIVCFILYGRTFSLGPDELDKLIRWGEVECSASLVFTTTDGKQYEVARFLDADGNHSSRISLVDDPENPLVRGNDAVRIKLYELTGYDYEHFVDSFYLAQREITMPHAHSYTVKTMAGIAPLERVMQSFEDELLTEEASMTTTLSELDGVQEEHDDLAIDREFMPSLQFSRSEKIAAEARQSEQLASLESGLVNYQESVAEYWRAKGKRGVAGFLSGLTFMLAAIAGTCWALLRFWPETSAAGQLVSLFSAMTVWNESRIPWLLGIAVAFSLLFIILILRRRSWNRSMIQHRDRALTLDNALNDIKETSEVSESANSGEEDGDVGSGQENAIDDAEVEAQAKSGDAISKRPDHQKLTCLRVRIGDLSASVTEVQTVIGEEIIWHKNELGLTQDVIQETEAAIDREQSRLDKADQLDKVATDLEEKLASQQRRVEKRLLAIDLLSGAANQISKRFNQELRELVSITLPLLTEDRYEHLKIDEELAVQAFSNEKRDFMDLEEISSGTQRQIMLSVRLALAQELINRTVKGDQFLFLDEPFAFFDAARTRNALEVLPTLSDEIAQIWIVAQQFPEDMSFDREIKCAREYQVIPAELND